jgi:hypothetical protein
MPIVETDFVIQAPMTTSGRFSSRANAVIVQNNGNCDVVLNNGFTLKPDQSLEFGNYGELNTVKVDIVIQFLPATATGDPVVQLIEIIEIIQNITGQGVYIDQPTLDVQ